MDVRSDRTGRPAPPPLSGDSRCTIPPAHAWSRRHPLGVVGEPAAGRIPSVPSVGGWSRLGASSRPQIGRWDRRQCHMPDFWVTGRPRNPLNASVATFCAAGVISMHQTPPGMVRGVSGVSRGRFVTISTGSQSERTENKGFSGILLIQPAASGFKIDLMAQQTKISAFTRKHGAF